LNNREIGRTDNMHRTWIFNVAKVLRSGKNRISIKFKPVLALIRKLEKRRTLGSLESELCNYGGYGWVRKQACNFGWDWGIRLVTCGIWRPIELVAFNEAIIKSVKICQEHHRKNRVALNVQTRLYRTGNQRLNAEFSVSFKGKPLVKKTISCCGTDPAALLEIENPKLWWPNGMGKQPLYLVRVDLKDSSGKFLGSSTRRIGLRTFTLQRKKDKWGESFEFKVNGMPFFAKGANWIPADAILARVNRTRYARLLGDAASCNMNMIRVWGGGVYEEDLFYDICDELGLCVWQDFMFACSMYPSFSTDFMRNVRQEAEDNINRLGHHACITLWCGNNEIEEGLVGDKWTPIQMSWADYTKLFDRLLAGVVKRYDPSSAYWPGSPHSPYIREDYNNPAQGDSHLWDVWFNKKPIEFYGQCMHRFISEFGFQSFAEPETVREYTSPEDRNVSSYIMEFHQRSPVGNDLIMTYLLSWFRMPGSFAMTLWLSQILQGFAVKYAVEHWRRNRPRTMGSLYWQLNDCWPVASWSSIDYYGRWKALQYMAKRFFAPLLISCVQGNSGRWVDVHVTSDMIHSVRGIVACTLYRTDGRIIKRETRKIIIKGQRNTKVNRLYLEKYLDLYGSRNLVLLLELKTGGRMVSDNVFLFAPPKHVEFEKAGINLKIYRQGPGLFTIALSSKKPAPWAWLTLQKARAKYSDNFTWLFPGRPRQIEMKTVKSMTLKRLREKLRVYSLRDTHNS
jgi:beta-mannosidase